MTANDDDEADELVHLKDLRGRSGPPPRSYGTCGLRPSSPWTVGGSGRARQHVVGASENLSGIALVHDVSVERVRRANPALWTTDAVFVGQVLKIPAAAAAAANYPAADATDDTDCERSGGAADFAFTGSSSSSDQRRNSSPAPRHDGLVAAPPPPPPPPPADLPSAADFLSRLDAQIAAGKRAATRTLVHSSSMSEVARTAQARSTRQKQPDQVQFGAAAATAAVAAAKAPHRHLDHHDHLC